MKNSSAPTFLVSLLIILLSFSIAFSAKNRTCYPKDLITLKKITAALGIDNPPGDCCDWDFVVCNRHPPHPVIELNFNDNPNITGHIPPAVSDLSSLFLLRFINDPNLTGNIPSAITKLPKLSILFISQTGLSGQIPTFLVNVKKLSYLDLSFNALTGTIPSELTRSPQLNTLDLSGNKLTGTIPESFGHFKSKIKFLFLSNNLLTGTVPASLGNLQLQTIDLSKNNFIGDASFLFSNNTITQNILLQENRFTFDFSKVVFPPFLTELNVSHNNIFGSLPKQLTEIILLDFDVSYNRLCGEIPQGGRLQSFGIESYSPNKCLCGSPLPACKEKVSFHKNIQTRFDMKITMPLDFV